MRKNWICEVQRAHGPPLRTFLLVVSMETSSIYCPQNNPAVVMFPAYRVDDCNASLWMCLEVLKMSSLQYYTLFLICLKCGKNNLETTSLGLQGFHLNSGNAWWRGRTVGNDQGIRWFLKPTLHKSKVRKKIKWFFDSEHWSRSA